MSQKKRRTRTHRVKPAKLDLKAAFDAAPDTARFPTEAAASGASYSASYLETLRRVGGGPKFLKTGRQVSYVKRDIIEWLESRGRMCFSTSDAAYAEAVRLSASFATSPRSISSTAPAGTEASAAGRHGGYA